MPNRKSRNEPLSDVRLQSFISNEIKLSHTYSDDNLSAKRRAAWDYYYSRPYGNEIEGRSSVVTSEVQDYVETIMGDLVEVFLEQKGPWAFQPTRQMSADACEDANKLVHYTLHELNPGWEIIHDTLKAACLFDVGYLKVTWDDGMPNQERIIRGQSGIEIVKLSMQQGMRIKDVRDAETGQATAPMEFNLQGVYDVTIEWDVPGHPKVWGCPYEEILHTPNIASFKQPVPFIAHRYATTRSALIENGFDEDLVYRLPTFVEYELSRDRQKRFQPENLRIRNNVTDPSVETVQMYECYVYADFDGDGRAEYGLVNAGGNGGQLIIFPDEDTGDDYTPISHHPFIAASAIRLPYKHPGRGFGELLAQTQKEKSAQRRQINDNIYYSTNGRHATNARVDRDSYLRNIVGMPVEIEGREPVSGAIEALHTESIVHQALPYLQYLDEEAQNRAGIRLNGELLSPEMLNSTFGGINLLMGAAKRRTLYVARTIAESLVELPVRIINLYIENQDEPMDVPIGNEWRQIDARTWPMDARAVVNFGFSNGTQAQRVAMYQQILMKQEQVAQMQGGFEGPWVNADDYTRMLHEWAEAMGLMASDMAFNELDEMYKQYQQQMGKKAQAEQQAQMQNPLMMQMQMEAGKAQAQSQAKLMQIQADERLGRYKLELEDQREREKIGLSHQTDILDINLDHQADLYKADLDDGTQQVRTAHDIRRKAQGDFLKQAASDKGPVQ